MTNTDIKELNNLSGIFNVTSTNIGVIPTNPKPIAKKTPSESVHIINKKLLKDFCQKYNLIVPNFAKNILEIYQDFTNTKGKVESRGIIQLYTVYFVLHIISAYWYSIKNIKMYLVKDKNNIITHILGNKNKGVKNNEFKSITSQMIKDFKTDINKVYEYMETLLTPHNPSSNITISIKDFLFKQPVNVNWKTFDTMLYNSLMLLIILYNLAYIIKLKKTDKSIKEFLFNVENNQTNEKVIHQLLLIFYFMIQHSSRAPYSGDINVKKSISQEFKQKNTHNNINKQEELYNTIQNSLHGINHNNSDKEIRTAGMFTILQLIFKLMHYHPFPFDAKLLHKKGKLDNNDEYITIRRKKGEDPTTGEFKLTGEHDNEALEIAGEIGTALQGFMSNVATVASLGKSSNPGKSFAKHIIKKGVRNSINTKKKKY